MKGRNFTQIDWDSMKIDIEQGWSADSIIIGACMRKPGLTERNAKLYYRAMTEGSCRTLEEARAWAVEKRMQSKRKKQERRAINRTDKRTFGPKDFEALVQLSGSSESESEIFRIFQDSGLTRENVANHYKTYRRFKDTTYDAHRKHYRMMKNGIHPFEETEKPTEPSPVPTVAVRKEYRASIRCGGVEMDATFNSVEDMVSFVKLFNESK